MRLIQTRLKKVPIQRPVARKSDYIGTATVYEPVGDILAEIQPVSALANTERFGVTISRGILILCAPDTDIRERDRVRWQDADYSVVGILTHNNILRVEAERVIV